MRYRWKRLIIWVITLLCLVMGTVLTGCGAGILNDVPQITEEVADAMDDEDSGEEMEPLKEENEIPEDGIISEAQMKTVSGEEGIYYFNGESKDSITYQWAYAGEKIQNPIEQKLKVEFSTENLKEIQKAANNAPYGIGVKFQKMELAAPVTLTVTLNEKWDADKVLLCTYQENKIYQIAQADIQTVKGADGKVSQIRVPLTKIAEECYLLGGSTEGSDQETEDSQNVKKNKDAKKNQNGDQNVTGETRSNGDEQQEYENQEDYGNDTGEVHTCTISIECSTILNNWDDLKSSKAEFVPADGWILYPSEVEYTPGETVFDVLKRVCNEAGIHMSSRYTPMYGSYYIEGMNQLYEFDCGQNSGWMYSVNGWFPNYGCSSYDVEDGDNIEWHYTCDLGSDVGNAYQGN